MAVRHGRPGGSVTRLALLIEYDGTCFSGWQAQRGRRTVQGVLEECASKLCSRDVGLTGSGRTDSGVHALGQVAHLDVEDDESSRISTGLPEVLPPDVAILETARAPDGFHCRFSALSRSYRYRIIRGRHPLLSRYAFQLPYRELDTEAMQKAASLCLGRHDWKGMAREGSSNRTWMVDVLDASVVENGAGWTMDIRADRFLRGMVRLWAGALVDVGRGRMTPEAVGDILLSGDRAMAGPSLPPQGLVLTGVEYPWRIFSTDAI